jgi:hypothetical protein
VRTPLASLIVLCCLALPASASASVSITSFKVTPSTTQAGAHPDVTVDTAFDLNPTSDDVKSVGVVLPQGLVGDPNAADRCSAAAFAADNCPATSKVGTTTASVIATVALVEMPQDAPGDVYSLQPKSGEPARLGIVLRPAAAGAIPLGKVFLQSGVTTGPQTGYGLATLFDGLPRTSGGLETRVTAMKLVLNGKASKGSFLTNPTDCREATTTASATSYDEPNTPKTATSSFTPTGCDKLPFAPQVSGSAGGAGQTGAAVSPTLTTVVSANPGDANAARVAVTLPAALRASLERLRQFCDVQTFMAGACPASTRVGSARAVSPLLAEPLTGPVTLTNNPVSGLPALAIQFGAPVPLTLFGDAGFAGSMVTTTIEGIPDLPLSRFELTIDGGGTNGLLLNDVNLCTASTQDMTLRGDLTAHSGRTASVSAPLDPVGCESTTASAGPSKPRGSLSLRFRRSRGTLVARFKPAAGAPALRRLRFAVPKSLRAARRGLRVRAGGLRSATLHGHTLDVRLGGRGARSISIRWTGIQPGRALARKLARRPPLTFVARLADAAGAPSTLRLTVRPAVRR